MKQNRCRKNRKTQAVAKCVERVTSKRSEVQIADLTVMLVIHGDSQSPLVTTPDLFGPYVVPSHFKFYY